MQRLNLHHRRLVSWRNAPGALVKSLVPAIASCFQSRICFCKPFYTMLPDAGTYHFPWEINSTLVPEGKTLRTYGRLHSYDMAISQAILTAQHASDQHCIPVCTKFVEPFQAQLGSLYIVLGETEFKDGEIIIKARVFTCVEGINLQLLEKAIEEQRKYFQERRKNHEGSIC